MGAFDDYAGFTAFYGYSEYGANVYGDGLEPQPANLTTCLTDQPGFCPVYTRFQLSGINLGLYIFEQNPLTYDVYPQRNTQKYSYILNSDNTVDQTYEKMEIQLTWDSMTEAMWNNLMVYSRKKVDGSSETLYFWDANQGRFCGKQIKMEGITAEVRGGFDPITRFNVAVKIREVGNSAVY